MGIPQFLNKLNLETGEMVYARATRYSIPFISPQLVICVCENVIKLFQSQPHSTCVATAKLQWNPSDIDLIFKS